MKKSRLLVTRISFIRNTSAEIKRKRKGRGPENRFPNIETELQKRLMEYASQQLGSYH
jgi:hypothetical protein